MSNTNYSAMSEITVKTQAELDAIPADYKGRIYIEFGTAYRPAVVRNRYGRSVVARGNSSVVAWENSSVVARGNSSVEARGNSSVVAWENSSVVAWENSSVVAWENSSVVARGNTQVVDRQIRGKIEISGNARIVYMPKTIREYMDFYGVKHDKKKATFYKAVHKRGGSYFSGYDPTFEYKVGETVREECDPETERECSYGIHIAFLDWALRFGADWNDLAILEVETKINDIVLPKTSDGKVRTCRVEVLREVPLSECGVYGKILEKRNRK